MVAKRGQLSQATQDRILPVAERVGLEERYAGRGVTIAFLDAGFYAHPDLMTPRTRIRAYYNVLTGDSGVEHLVIPHPSAWHGMMTSVVCAGNGYLSGGRYRGLAHESDVVLIKVGSLSRIRHDDIALGIEWVLANMVRHNIRVLNISCGGDYEATYLTDHLSRMAEAAVRQGIVVVCAAGNAGHEPGHPVVPPASAPSVITVGGLNDEGNPRLGKFSTYHSSYGPTIDGLQKPEVIAPAIWLAAPLLPGTPTAEEARLLNLLDAAEDHELQGILAAHRGVSRVLDEAVGREPYLIRQIIAAQLHDQKVIDQHYKHVDGTSFAAPIVSSIVACMLEANPGLRPHQIKRILIDTAQRLNHVPVDRQGWGVVQAAAAVRAAESRR
ncbi:MAG: S8 family serine peptidase [Myxococcales bacterium]|nr:S8 family serine peptidase [Polyangiaceae bacterium]MDW8249544.1 S8 family serine peptidase [Myxococcales bacterium]